MFIECILWVSPYIVSDFPCILACSLLGCELLFSHCTGGEIDPQFLFIIQPKAIRSMVHNGYVVHEASDIGVLNA